MSSFPVLYSFRRCPYAIRARMAILWGGRTVWVREVLLKEMPWQMLTLSQTCTVPMLVSPRAKVLEESLEIMIWALEDQKDHWQRQWLTQAAWIEQNDTSFKHWLDRYKYADRHPQHPPTHYRHQAMEHLLGLEDALSTAGPFLLGEEPALVDLALFPFVRQFRVVDPDWFDSLRELEHLRVWLDRWLASPEFHQAMVKYPVWDPEDEPVWFGPLSPSFSTP